MSFAWFSNHMPPTWKVRGTTSHFLPGQSVNLRAGLSLLVPFMAPWNCTCMGGYMDHIWGPWISLATTMESTILRATDEGVPQQLWKRPKAASILVDGGMYGGPCGTIYLTTRCSIYGSTKHIPTSGRTAHLSRKRIEQPSLEVWSSMNTCLNSHYHQQAGDFGNRLPISWCVCVQACYSKCKYDVNLVVTTGYGVSNACPQFVQEIQ